MQQTEGHNMSSLTVLLFGYAQSMIQGGRRK